ncbi:MAG: deaminase [Alphaproteobacteria bacterium]|nr:deaminase [Alphaproteobacteria bacterium]
MTRKTTPPSPRRSDAWAEHRRWLDRAEQVAMLPVSKGGSPHPSVRVGAVLVDAKGREIAAAANRFAEGVDRRRAERYQDGGKSLWINCAEQLALMQALREGKKVAGARLYVTLEPCAICAGLIAELKIAEVCVPVDSMRRYAKLKAKWKDSIEIGLIKLAEAGTRLIAVDTHKSVKKNAAFITPLRPRLRGERGGTER